MTLDDILRLAREAGAMTDWGTPKNPCSGPELAPDDFVMRPDELRGFAAAIEDAARASFTAAIQAALDHAALNDLRLPPNFGRRTGDPAVRAGHLEATLEGISRARVVPKPDTKLSQAALHGRPKQSR